MTVILFTNTLCVKDGWSQVGAQIFKQIQENYTKNIFVFTAHKHRKEDKVLIGLMSEAFFKHKFFSIALDFFIVLLKTFTNRKDIKAIICNVEYYAFIAFIFAKIYKKPLILVAHGTYALRLPERSALYRLAFKAADKVVCVSRYTKSKVYAERFADIDQLSVINLGVDKDKFYPSDNSSRMNRIIFVGNAKPRKGLVKLLQAMVKASKELEDIELKVVGEIDKHTKSFFQLNDIIAKNGLNVDFCGRKSDEELKSLYQSGKLNVLLSQEIGGAFEGFGLVHLEANACGSLTVGSLHSGNEDAIQSHCGFLIHSNDVNELAGIIVSICSLENYPKIDFNSIRGWDEFGSEFISIIDDLVRHKGIQTT
ncbi:glycosyltransferase family 4 protein [Amylibacter sp.]|nr:glycosyltransferase family 4 protein [Amylibacter sp.]